METREVTDGYRLSHWARIIQERTESSERVEEYCLRKGISKHKYYYWQQKLRKAAGVQLAKQESKPADLALPRFAEVRVSEPSVLTGAIGNDHICIETGMCKITAGSRYPAEALVSVLHELAKLC